MVDMSLRELARVIAVLSCMQREQSDCPKIQHEIAENMISILVAPDDYKM